MIATAEIVRQAGRLAERYDVSDPFALAESLGITVLVRPFREQKGAYKVILRNRFIFLQSDLHPVLQRIVLYHEIGHDQLHRTAAVERGGFEEFNIFDMQKDRMEYEANIFASQLALPDKEFLSYLEQGYDAQQIASLMNSDINLVALKTDTLISQGYRLRPQEHQSDFLKPSRDSKTL